MELAAKLNAIIPDPGCVYDAIEPILANCESPEDVTARTRIAVALALCELSAAGVTFPSICQDPSRLTECTQQLESKPTWWTTFSGQYRHISLVCKEYQPTFASEKVVSVFKDAYNAYSEHKDQFSAELAKLQRLKEETTDILQSMSGELSSSLIKIRFQTQNLVSDTEMSQANILALNKALECSLQTTNAQSAKLANLSTVFGNQITTFDNKILSFSKSMAELRDKHEKTAQVLARSADHTAQVLRHADRTLIESAAILRGVGKICAFFGVLLGPLGLTTISLGLFLFAWKTKRNRPIDVLFL